MYVYMASPHSKCEYTLSESRDSKTRKVIIENRTCDILASDTITKMYSKFKANGFKIEMLLSDNLRSAIDYNRRPAMCSLWRMSLRNAVGLVGYDEMCAIAKSDIPDNSRIRQKEPNKISVLLEIHSYPPDYYQHWGNHDVVILNNKENKKNGEMLEDHLRSKGIDTITLVGKLYENNIQYDFTGIHNVFPFMLEFNEEITEGKQEKVINEVCEFFIKVKHKDVVLHDPVQELQEVNTII